MPIRTLLAAVAAASLGVPGAAQRLLTVDAANGPYRNVAAAIAVARPGDRIEVLSGSYPGFTLDRPVAVVGRGADPPQTGPIRITTIPAGQIARIANLSAVGGLAGTGISCVNVAGRIEIDRIRVLGLRSMRCTGSAAITIESSALPGSTQIADCRAVVVRGCQLGAIALPLDVRNSDVTLVDTVVRGFAPLRVPAVQLTGGILRLSGPRNRLSNSSGPYTNPADVIVGSNGARVERDPKTTLTPDKGGCAICGATTTTRRRPALAATAARLPGTVDVALDNAPAGTTYALAISLSGPPSSLGTADTPLWLDPSSSLLVAQGALRTGGKSVRVPVDVADALIGRAFTWQGATLENGRLELTNPAGYTHFR